MKLKVGVQVWMTLCNSPPTEDRGSEVRGISGMNRELSFDNLDGSDRVILVEEMIAKVGSEKLEKVVTASGVPEANGNRNAFADMNSNLRIMNAGFRLKETHIYKWRQGRRMGKENVEYHEVQDYVYMDARMKNQVVDTWKCRG